MSFDISIHVPGKHGTTSEEWDRNLTYNLSSMMREGGLILGNLDGERAGALVATLQDLHKSMLDDPERYKAHNPPNGWGDYDGLLRFVHDFAVVAEAHPDGIVLIS